MSDQGSAEVSVDRLLGGRLAIRQPTSGHRAGTDAVLLAAAAGPRAGDRILDVGAGVGTIGLALALREPGATVELLEREPSLAVLARSNVRLNDLDERVTVAERDLFVPSGRNNLATLVVSNPPFYANGRFRPAADPLKARAHTAEATGHGAWLRGMLGMLAPHGRLVMIHRPEALQGLLMAAECRLGGVRIQPIHAREGETAIRILIGGIVGSRAPLTIAAPLILHGPSGSFTAAAAALHRGEAAIPLLDAPTRRSRP